MSDSGPSAPQFFEEKYRQNGDPWNFASSPYELFRYDATIAALSRRRYRYGMEPGCSVGVLTERLAGLCDRVAASDFSATAVEQARKRCLHLPRVEVRCACLDESTSAEDADLLVLSEIGYYFRPEAWRRLASGLTAGMLAGGTVLATHWTGHSIDHQMNGNDVHRILREVGHLKLEHAETHAGFRLDRWVRA